MVLDIEPSCPKEISEYFLSMNWLYAERSMSGLGYHLLFPLEESYKDIALGKQKLREENGYYEFLLNHYVTFTRNSLPVHAVNPMAPAIKPTWDALAAAAQIDETKRVNTDMNIKSVYKQSMIMNLMVNQVDPYEKTPDDFKGDMSKYEFGYISYLFYRLRGILVLINEHRYTDDEIAFILYEASKICIPYRPKHEEMRTGMPWLYFQVTRVMAKSDSIYRN